MRLLFTLILLFSLDSFTARSQALIFQATRLHDDGSHATLIVPASDQGSLVAGYSTRGSTGFLDLTKFDEFRDRKWSVTYEVTDTLLRTKAACNFGEDGYLIAASLESPPPGGTDILLVRTDTAGSIGWARRYSVGLSCSLSALTALPDGGFLATGTVLTDTSALYEDVLLLRGASDGSILWAESIGTSSRETATSLIRTSDDQYAIAGTSTDANNIRGSFISKLDTSGNYYWFTLYETGILDEPRALLQSDNGGYQICGRGGPGGDDVLLLRTDANGSPAFARLYRLSFGSYQLDETALGMSATPDGGFLIGGEVLRPGTTNPWIFLVKFSANLLTEWFDSYAFSTSRDQRFGALLQQADGGLLIAGSRRASISDPWSSLTMSTDPVGSTGCLETALNESDSLLTPLSFNLGPITRPLIASGSSAMLQSVVPVWTSDSACFTITSVESLLSPSRQLRCYPQPAGESFRLSGSEGDSFGVSYRIIDLTGRIRQSGLTDATSGEITIPLLPDGYYQVLLDRPSGELQRCALLVQKP
jgi:hypothetical protein